MLHEIDVVFSPRHFGTLLGPSLCGKTTLPRLIAGLERVSTGSTRFGDRRRDNFALGAGTADSIPGRVWLVELLGSEKPVDIETGPQ